MIGLQSTSESSRIYELLPIKLDQANCYHIDHETIAAILIYLMVLVCWQLIGIFVIIIGA